MARRRPGKVSRAGVVTEGSKSKAVALPRHTYLNLPAEVKGMIFDLLWSGDRNIHIAYSMLDKTDPKFDRGYGRLFKPCRGRARDIVSMILVCRQSRNDAATFLYGTLTYSSYNAIGMVNQFIPKMRPFNAARLRSLQLGVPEALKVNPEQSIERFLHIFCDKLKNLDSLEFTTKFSLCSQSEGSDGEGTIGQHGKELRAILHTAAAITEHHPKLKTAIFLAKSGLSDEIEYECWFFLKIISCDIKHVVGTNTDFSWENTWDHDEDKGEDRDDGQGKYQVVLPYRREREDWLLDSKAIRATGWSKFIRARDYATNLSADDTGYATSEDIHAEEFRKWSEKQACNARTRRHLKKIHELLAEMREK